MLTYLTFLDTNEDKEHFILLYEVYHRQLYYVAFRILGKKEEAEDGVQEMYLRLVKYIDRIDVGVYPILKTYLKERGESAELMFTDFLKMQEKRKQKKCHKTWGYLMSILKSVIADQCRKSKREQELCMLNFCEEWMQKGVEESVIDIEDNRLLLKYILELSELYKQTLLLQYYYKYSPEETGRILGKSADNIRHISARAKKKLRKKMEEGGYER